MFNFLLLCNSSYCTLTLSNASLPSFNDAFSLLVLLLSFPPLSFPYIPFSLLLSLSLSDFLRICLHYHKHLLNTNVLVIRLSAFHIQTAHRHAYKDEEERRKKKKETQ